MIITFGMTPEQAAIHALANAKPVLLLGTEDAPRVNPVPARPPVAKKKIRHTEGYRLTEEFKAKERARWLAYATPEYREKKRARDKLHYAAYVARQRAELNAIHLARRNNALRQTNGCQPCGNQSGVPPVTG
jgi:hypothetical protein